MKHHFTTPAHGAHFTDRHYPDLAYQLAQSELARRERMRISWTTWFISVLAFSFLAFLYGIYVGAGLGSMA